MDNTSSTIISYIVICNNSKGSVLKLQEKIKQRSVSATRKSNSKMNEKVSDAYSNYPRYHMKLSFSFLKQMLNKKGSRITIIGIAGQMNMSTIKNIVCYLSVHCFKASNQSNIFIK
jgi:hypothetical protein